MAKLFIILDTFTQTITPKDTSTQPYTRISHNVITSDSSNYIHTIVSECDSSTKDAIEIDDKWYKVNHASSTYHPTLSKSYASYCKKQIISPDKDILNCIVLEGILNSQVSKKMELSKEFDLDRWIGEE